MVSSTQPLIGTFDNGVGVYADYVKAAQSGFSHSEEGWTKIIVRIDHLSRGLVFFDIAVSGAVFTNKEDGRTGARLAFHQGGNSYETTLSYKEVKALAYRVAYAGGRMVTLETLEEWIDFFNREDIG